MGLFLKKCFFSLYEWIQIELFFFLYFFSKIIKQKKFLRFVHLRNPNVFKKQLKVVSHNFFNLINKNKDAQIYWFHVASAGEMEQAIPVARKLNEKLNAFFFVTYYSPSTEPFLLNFPNMIGSCGLPIDVRILYQPVFDLIPIKKIFFVRYDIWPSLLYVCSERNIEINLISGTKLKTRSGFIGYFSKKWNESFYKKFSRIFAVSMDDVLFFQKFIPKGHVYLSGDAKWARSYQRAQENLKMANDQDFSFFIKFLNQKRKEFHFKNIVFGSPHKAEHNLVLQLVSLKEKLCIIYAPHDVSKKACEILLSELKSAGFNSILYTDLVQKLKISSSDLTTGIDLDFDVVIIDCIGFLAEIYQAADAAVIGGGFDGQIHNALEATAHGVPVLIGNKFTRAREVQTLVSEQAAVSFESPNQLFQFLSQWVSLDGRVSDPALRLAYAKSAAVKLFHNIPDTSEVIFKALSSG